MTEPWMSAYAIATHLDVTQGTAYTWIAEKHIPAHEIERLWKLQASEVDDSVRSGGQWRRGRFVIDRLSEGFLRALAKASSVQTENVTISGTLSTISKNHKQELTLEDQTRVKFSATEEQLRELAPHALSSVALQLIEKTAVKLATGTVSRSYTLIGLREAELEIAASQSGQSVD